MEYAIVGKKNLRAGWPEGFFVMSDERGCVRVGLLFESRFDYFS